MKGFDFSRLRVLVVEDERFMRAIVVRLLQELGVADVVEAVDGADALKALRRDGRRFDIIILDLEMPILGGGEFLRYLRESPDLPDQRIPVLVLTGHGEEARVREAAGLGIQGYLLKPVSRKDLAVRIVAAVSARKPAPPEGGRP